MIRFVVGLLTTAAVVAVAVVASLRLMGADVVLTNMGPQTIHVRGALPSAFESALATAGIFVPDELPPGEPQHLRVPRLGGIQVDVTGGQIQLDLLGQSMRIAAACDRFDFDGASLIGHRSDIDLSARPAHDVQFACH